jgi:hypothetical protein
VRFSADDPRYEDWEAATPAIVRTHNASPTATGKSPDEIVFGFQPFALLPPATSNLPEERTINRLEAKDALAYAEIVIAERHNAKHKPWSPAVSDLVYVRLHKGYQVASKIHHKFGAQRTGPFKVVDAYPNACRLALPPKWKIHPVISIEHLEPHPQGQDKFDRAITHDLPEPSDEANHWATFECILNKQITHKGKRTRYLLRRRGMGPAWDEWQPEAQVLLHRPDLLEAFAS